MRKVIILSGIPGSGKSSWASRYFVENRYLLAEFFSADFFFICPDGKYLFNRSRLPEAHAECLKMFSTAVLSTDEGPKPRVLLVDNTNTSALEIAPYAALALAWGWELEIWTFKCPPELGAARNVHGVPLKTCKDMAERLANRRLPPYWTKYERVVEVAEGP